MLVRASCPVENIMSMNHRFAQIRDLAIVLALLDLLFRVVRPAQRMAIDPIGPMAIGTYVLFLGIFALVWLLSVQHVRMSTAQPQPCRKARCRDTGADRLIPHSNHAGR